MRHWIEAARIEHPYPFLEYRKYMPWQIQRIYTLLQKSLTGEYLVLQY
jgi:hypothetical protein